MSRTLYPTLQAPVLPPDLEPEQVTESRWHQPWSDPVGTIWKKAKDTRTVALIASGPYEGIYDSTIEPGKTYMPWFNWLSEPVRVKPRLNTGSQQSLQYVFSPSVSPTILVSEWFIPLSEPKRFPKRLPAALNPYEFDAYEAVSLVTPGTWFQWWSEPVRHKLRLETALQYYPLFTRLVPPNPPIGVNLPLYTKSTATYNTGGYPANYWKGRG